MKILIVDDERLARLRLRQMISELDGAEFAGEASNGCEALALATKVCPDVVLLDIRMPTMDGLETAVHFSVGERPPAVIFTTAYGDHALAAFDAHAVDYLLKPIRKQRLEQALARTRKLNRAQLRSVNDTLGRTQARSHIAAKTHRGVDLIALADIYYFQAEDKYVTVRHQGGQVLIDEALKSLESEFSDQFIRIHRNALVAVAHVAAIKKENSGRISICFDSIGDTLPVSRRHAHGVKRRLLQS